MNENHIMPGASGATGATATPGAPTLKQLPAEERPRERLFQNGAERLTDAELLGLLLGSGVRGATAVDLGRRLVAAFGSLRGLARCAAAEIAGHKGIGHARAARVAAGLELGRRLAATPLRHGVTIDGSEAVREHFGPLLADLPRERLYAILLDRRNRVIREHMVSEGTLDEAVAHPRDVFLPAIREHASALVLLHNHPSGNAAPSHADIAMTRRLAVTGKLLGIPILDHVIVGAGRDWSSIARLSGGSIDALCGDLPLALSVAEPRATYDARPSGEQRPDTNNLCLETPS